MEAEEEEEEFVSEEEEEQAKGEEEGGKDGEQDDDALWLQIKWELQWKKWKSHPKHCVFNLYCV